VEITKDPEGKLLSKSKYREKMKTIGGISVVSTTGNSSQMS
jgi:cobalamin biosynthesis protein CbiD